MCGIAGVVHLDGRPVDQRVIERMCATMVHRGPDDQGILVRANVGLGNRRLSIIDPSHGRQPITNEDRSVHVVHNGEIYNFVALRKQLESKGHEFGTHCDTEVLVHAYEEWGTRFLEHLEGMFAIALWDERKEVLVLARDRVGIKPLFYSARGTSLAFGSELASLAVTRSAASRVDAFGLWDYLAHGHIVAPRTIYADVRKLLPGHFLRVRLSLPNGPRLEELPYWDLRYQPVPTRTVEEWQEEFLPRFRRSVLDHLVSDVPVGAFLSGGTDSSAVVAAIATQSSRPLETFSVGFREGGFDESRFARMVAEHFGTIHHERILGPETSDLLPTLVETYGEPFADSSALAMYRVAAFASERVKVVLAGDGGDEASCGYPRYHWTHQASRFWAHVPRAMQALAVAGSRIPLGFRGKGSASLAQSSALERYLTTVRLFTAAEVRRILAPDLVREVDGYNLNPLYPEYFNRYLEADDLFRMQYLDIKTRLPDDYLTKVDRASMRHSLEVRVPFLDHRLLEFMVNAPSCVKLAEGRPKYALKRAARALGVPPDVLFREKMGFSVPISDWTSNGWTSGVTERPPNLRGGRELLNREWLESDGPRQLSGGQRWALMVLSEWARSVI